MRRFRGKRHVTRGQALVEFAMFFLVLMFLLAGVINIGQLLSDHVSLVYAARTGARTASVLNNKDNNADCAIIGAIDAALVDMPNIQLNKITIYQADANGQPAAVATVYAGNTTCINTNGVLTLSQAPLAGNTYPSSARANTLFYEDSIGVQLDYTYTFQLPILFSGTFTAYDRAVMPANPLVVPTPG